MNYVIIEWLALISLMVLMQFYVYTSDHRWLIVPLMAFAIFCFSRSILINQAASGPASREIQAFYLKGRQRLVGTLGCSISVGIFLISLVFNGELKTFIAAIGYVTFAAGVALLTVRIENTTKK